MSPFFSILTPAWNRRTGLERLYKSLCLQDFDDFEWLIGDDGSTDGSLEFLLAISAASPFPLRIISSDRRIGKASMDNLLLDSVSGKYFICCDSDDWLLPKALSNFSCAILEGIKTSQHLDFVCALNITSCGSPASTITLPFNSLTSLTEVFSSVAGDASIALRSQTFSSCRHEEVDFVVTESLFYSHISDNAFGLVLDCLVKVMDRTYSNSISFSPGIKYCRGSAYSLRSAIGESASLRWFQAVSLIRFSLNGDLPHRFFLPPLLERHKSLSQKLRLFLFLLPIGILFSLRDHLFGGLIKSHIQFDNNRACALIKYHG